MEKIYETSIENNTAEKPDYAKEIVALIRSAQSPKVLLDRLAGYHENDIGEAVPELTRQERKKLYSLLSLSTLSDVLEHMDEEEAVVCLEEMDITKAVSVISNMESDDAAYLLDLMPEDKHKLILSMMDEESKRDVEMVASFADDEIGSRMTTDYIMIKRSLSIKDAMRELIKQAAENSNVSTIFVVDSAGIFYGAIDLRDLIIARDNSSLKDLVTTSFPYVYAHETIADCIETLKDYSEDSIPVLDNNNRILGVITSQNLIEVVDEEMGEDYARFAGLTAEEDLSEPVVESIKKRLPWLATLLLLGLIVSAVVSAFEKVVSQLPLIMAFQSLILDMAGNVGTQSLAVTIRVLMDETLTFRQKATLVLKETRVGLCNGLVLGIASFIIVALFLILFKNQTPVFSFAVSGCIGIALIAAMIVSSAIGTTIPVFFKQINVDPAAASGPLITTINDLVAVVTYYGLSWLILIKTMHFGP